MNIQLFARVLWRFKYMVGAGFLVALALGILTIYKVDLTHGAPKLTPRTRPLYSSNAQLLVTQKGFPWGSAIQQYVAPAKGESSVPSGDLGRLTGLTNLYVQLANSDTIRLLVAKKAPRPSGIVATQNYSFSPTYYSSALPILTITGTSTSRAKARLTTQIGAEVLTDYLKQQQDAAGIEDSQRVVIQELVSPRKTALVDGPKKTLPVVVIFTIMLAVIGLAFVLENLRPRVPAAVVARADAAPLIESARRSA
jgi:hypothetical protein